MSVATIEMKRLGERGSHAPRVILFGFILAIILIILEVLIVPAGPIVAPEVGADGKSEPAEQRPERHESLAPLSEFTLAPIVSPPEIRQLRPIPARRLAWRSVSHHSSDRYSSPNSSSSSSPSYHSVSGHTPPMLIHLHYRDLFIDHLLGLYDVRSLDSSTPSSGSSRKRCRSPATSVPSPTHDSRSIAPTPADLLPPRKRFRYPYSPEDSGEFEIAASDVMEDDEEFEVEASATDTREIAVDLSAIGDSSESSTRGIPDLEDTIFDIVHYMLEVRIDMITEIETTQRQLEAS
ncbi:hypothetical protein Tco_0282162 [Tanacetum coccineum]